MTVEVFLNHERYPNQLGMLVEKTRYQDSQGLFGVKSSRCPSDKNLTKNLDVLNYLQARGTAARQEKQQCDNQRLLHCCVKEAVLLQKIDKHQHILATLESKRASVNEGAPLYEINTETDQIMTHLNVAVANSALSAREHYLGETYRRALPQTLYRVFFGQEGYVEESAHQITIMLDPYRDPVVQADVWAACEALNQRQIRTFDGQLIHISVDDCT